MKTGVATRLLTSHDLDSAMTRLFSFLLIAGLLTLSGCLVVQEKHFAVSVMPDQNRLDIYYVFEHISVLNGHDVSKVRDEVNALKANDFSFMVQGSKNLGDKNELLDYCEFGELMFFIDPQAERQLCAHRRVSIVDLQSFEELLNRQLCENLKDTLFKETDEEIYDRARTEIERMKKFLATNDGLRFKDQFDSIPAAALSQPLSELMLIYDLDSIAKLRKAVDDEFMFLRFENNTISFSLPATSECTQKMLDDSVTKKVVEQLKVFTKHVSLERSQSGIKLVIGNESEVVQFLFKDLREHEPEAEKRLHSYVGSPEPILTDGVNTATSESLIKQFQAETRGQADPK